MNYGLSNPLCKHLQPAAVGPGCHGRQAHPPIQTAGTAAADSQGSPAGKQS